MVYYNMIFYSPTEPAEHLPEDIVAHVEERRADVAVLVDRCSND